MAGPRRGARDRHRPARWVVQTDTHKSAFVYDAATGAKLGQWVLPRPQTIQENGTIHNYNLVPLPKRYGLVSGNYPSGISVVDFTTRPPPGSWPMPTRPAGADPARRCLVDLLVHRPHLCVRHHPGFDVLRLLGPVTVGAGSLRF